MIPTFPYSKEIEVTDKDEIENLTKQFKPYNDFEFIDLWIYNPGNNTSISVFNDTFIVKRQDYITEDFFYTFQGNSDTQLVIQMLLEESKKEHLHSLLKHVPAESIENKKIKNSYIVTEDPDNFDYILSVEELATLSGGKYYDKRNLINRFKKLYSSYTVKMLNLQDIEIQAQIKNLFYLWEKQKGKDRAETAIELIAMEKLFNISELCKIKGLGIYIDNKLIGFTTYHALTHGYGGMSLEKADTSYEGIYSLLNHETAKELQKLGCVYINYEQDLGIPGLKKAKQLWRPIHFLKKYTIQEKL